MQLLLLSTPGTTGQDSKDSWELIAFHLLPLQAVSSLFRNQVALPEILPQA